jgi:hypothetical protein
MQQLLRKSKIYCLNYKCLFKLKTIVHVRLKLHALIQIHSFLKETLDSGINDTPI